MRKFLLPFLIISFGIILFFSSPALAGDTLITNLSLNPSLDISYFGNYTFTADITPEPGSATVTLAETTDNSPASFHYCVDGMDITDSDSYSMSIDSGSTWKATGIRPDEIYPSIAFAPFTTFWNNSPTNINVRRQNYHVLHFSNPLIMSGDMNFWIEVNATPVSLTNSSDLLVYLVNKGHNVNFFNSDWRNDSVNTELVGTINRNMEFNHTHTSNSSHYLIRLTANGDKTIGLNNLDISGDFWVILYDNSPNTARGWNLKYQTTSTCSSVGRWYVGNITGWTTTAETGYPDVHVHFARRTNPTDGINATVVANGQTASSTLTFAALPNLPPNSTSFIVSTTGVYSNTINVSWNPATDPNTGDTISYNLYAVDSGNNETSLATNLSSTTFSWNTTSPTIPDGNYTLKGEACDASLCTSFYSEPFNINNAVANIYSLSAITMTSDNSDSTKAQAGNHVTLSFTATGTINTPTVKFYSGGNNVSNSTVVTNVSGNSWTASYLVSSSDTDGQVTFTVSSANLDLEYSEITGGTYVTIYSTSPTTTPTPVISDTSNDSNFVGHNCDAAKPVGKPDLFQVDVNSTDAILYYAPVIGKVTNYYISFSEKSGNLEHGAFTSQGGSNGVLSFKIDHLKPSTTYYFRVRSQNDCIPGEWSREMKITTRRVGEDEFVKNYKNIFTKIYWTVSQITNNIVTTDNHVNEINDNKTITTPSPTVQPASQIRKRCFLWWCW